MQRASATLCVVLSLWVFLAAALAQPLAAQQSGDAGAGYLPRAIEWTAHRPPGPQQALASSYSRLSWAIAGLEHYLARGGYEASHRWQTWLDLPALKAELSQERPDLAALRRIEQRYYRNQPGLELDPFLALRRELRSYIAACDYAALDSPQEHYQQQLAELATLLAQLDAEPSSADADRAGQIVAWLEPLSGEGAQLAAAVRARYCRPNLVALASGRLADRLLRQTVAEQRAIAEEVLGSFTRGIAYTWGNVSFGMVPNHHNATLEVRLVGQTSVPSNVAERGNIRVHGSSQTAIRAAKQVHINDRGLHLMPAVAWCSTSVQVHDVSAPRRLIERIATRRVEQLRPQAEQAASQRTASEARTSLDQRAGEALAGANDVFCNNIRAPLVRLAALPSGFRFWSDQQHLRFSLSQHSGEQLAAASPPPALPSDYDLSGAVHESMLDNLAETLLGGRTARDEIWHDVINVITGRAPRQLWVHDRSERWSVTFSRKRPLRTQFDDDRMGILLRLERVERGARTLEHPVEIEARFTPHITPDGPGLVREGDLEIRLADGIDPELAYDWQNFLRRKLGAVLAEEIYFDGLVPPAGGTLGKLRELDLVVFSTRDGWLTVAYQWVPAQSAE
jgi:hypothetical protein